MQYPELKKHYHPAVNKAAEIVAAAITAEAFKRAGLHPTPGVSTPYQFLSFTRPFPRAGLKPVTVRDLDRSTRRFVDAFNADENPELIATTLKTFLSTFTSGSFKTKFSPTTMDDLGRALITVLRDDRMLNYKEEIIDICTTEKMLKSSPTFFAVANLAKAEELLFSSGSPEDIIFHCKQFIKSVPRIIPLSSDIRSSYHSLMSKAQLNIAEKTGDKHLIESGEHHLLQGWKAFLDSEDVDPLQITSCCQSIVGVFVRKIKSLHQAIEIVEEGFAKIKAVHPENNEIASVTFLRAMAGELTDSAPEISVKYLERAKEILDGMDAFITADSVWVQVEMIYCLSQAGKISDEKTLFLYEEHFASLRTLFLKGNSYAGSFLSEIYHLSLTESNLARAYEAAHILAGQGGAPEDWEKDYQLGWRIFEADLLLDMSDMTEGKESKEHFSKAVSLILGKKPAEMSLNQSLVHSTNKIRVNIIKDDIKSVEKDLQAAITLVSDEGVFQVYKERSLIEIRKALEKLVTAQSPNLHTYVESFTDAVNKLKESGKFRLHSESFLSLRMVLKDNGHLDLAALIESSIESQDEEDGDEETGVA